MSEVINLKPVKVELMRMALKPGDKLVIKVKEKLSLEHWGALQQGIGHLLEGSGVAAFFINDLDMEMTLLETDES